MVKTDHILFIASGAFHLAKPSDLIPELQGRFPIRVELGSLSVDDFEAILTQTHASLVKQYTLLLATEGVTLRDRARRDPPHRPDRLRRQRAHREHRRPAAGDGDGAAARRRQLRRAEPRRPDGHDRRARRSTASSPTWRRTSTSRATSSRAGDAAAARLPVAVGDGTASPGRARVVARREAGHDPRRRVRRRRRALLRPRVRSPGDAKARRLGPELAGAVLSAQRRGAAADPRPRGRVRRRSCEPAGRRAAAHRGRVRALDRRLARARPAAPASLCTSRRTATG